MRRPGDQTAVTNRRAVFLDRDGVLNRAVLRDGNPYAPANVAELELLPGVEEACAALRRAGLLLIVVTNQPDIARGTQSHEVVDAINSAVRRRLLLDDVRCCPHDDADRCACRKPQPGMILAAASEWNVSLPRSVLVGDRWRDIDSGRRAGCRTVFVDHGYRERRPDAPDLTVKSLAEAVPWILETLTPNERTIG